MDKSVFSSLFFCVFCGLVLSAGVPELHAETASGRVFLDANRNQILVTNETGIAGVPFWNVTGNHDMNYDAPSDATSLETCKKFYGHNYCAFEYDKAHFIVLDDIRWIRERISGGGTGSDVILPQTGNFLSDDS